MTEYISTAELTKAPSAKAKVHRLPDDGGGATSCGKEAKANWEFGVKNPPNPVTKADQWCRECFTENFILIRGAWITFDQEGQSQPSQ